MLTATESRSVPLLPNKATSPELPSKKDIRLEAGDYVVRLALSEGERAAAYRLRFLVFNLEMNEGLESAYADGYDKDHFDDVCDHMIVEDKTTGAFVGQCGLRPVDEGAGPEIDLAYHYTRASWNKGYATEAAIAVIGHGLGPVSLAAIMAVVVPENIGSWRVMEKAGMRYQGLVDYYGMAGLKKYIAAREWWRSPLAS